MSEPRYKMVDGTLVEMTPEEIAEFEAMQEESPAPPMPEAPEPRAS